MDAAIGAVVGHEMRLPDHYRALVLAGVAASDQSARDAARRTRLRADMERAQGRLLAGYVTEEQFLTRQPGDRG